MSENTLSSHEIIKIKESELVSKLKVMSIDELELHAQNIMKDMGSSDYSQIMASVMKSLKEDQSEGYSRFETVQKKLQDSLPNKAYMSDIYARLAAIVMTIISRKFQDLL